MNNQYYVTATMRELTGCEIEAVSGGYFYLVAIVLALSSCTPEIRAVH